MKLLVKKVANPFHDLLREALDVERELREMEEPANRKLSAAAFVREALVAGRTTSEKTSALRRTIEEDGGRAFPGVWGFVRGATRFIGEATCTRPPVEVRRLRFLDSLDGAAQSEGAGIGAGGLLELFAVAATIAAERHPEAFGTVEDWDAKERRFEELGARRTVLFQRIEREYGAEDLIFDFAATPQALLAQGYLKVSFKISGSAVTPGPGCGERLVGWLVAHPEALS